jgi:predicted transcriptional regulator
MAELTPIQGELQVQIMSVLWRLEEGTVEQVRSGLPRRYRGAYTTVQTVLNRLGERGMLVRRKERNTVIYVPRFSEAEYLSKSIEATLAGASTEARQVALAQLVGGLERKQLADLQKLAKQIDQLRDR